ncbi:MAG: hypothetical protein EA399_05285 [Desulfovibrionales bacterium]|nr:MAG: hypothetical protein EA399_05285 [Desulfovibrionales bacterium]
MSRTTPETDFTVTPQALTILERYFSDNPTTPMRLIHASGGCAGERLALTLEDADPGSEDISILREGYQFTVAQELLHKTGPITVDANRLGFIIHSSMELDQGGCASCTSCPSGSG